VNALIKAAGTPPPEASKVGQLTSSEQTTVSAFYDANPSDISGTTDPLWSASGMAAVTITPPTTSPGSFVDVSEDSGSLMQSRSRAKLVDIDTLRNVADHAQTQNPNPGKNWQYVVIYAVDQDGTLWFYNKKPTAFEPVGRNNNLHAELMAKNAGILDPKNMPANTVDVILYSMWSPCTTVHGTDNVNGCMQLVVKDFVRKNPAIGMTVLFNFWYFNGQGQGVSRKAAGLAELQTYLADADLLAATMDTGTFQLVLAEKAAMNWFMPNRGRVVG